MSDIADPTWAEDARDLTEPELAAIEARHHRTIDGGDIAPHSDQAERIVLTQAIAWTTLDDPCLLAEHPSSLFYNPSHRAIADTITKSIALAEAEPRDPQHIVARIRQSDSDEAAQAANDLLADLLREADPAALRAARLEIEFLAELRARREAHTLLYQLRNNDISLDVAAGSLAQLTDAHRTIGLKQIDLTATIANPPPPARPDVLATTTGGALFYTGKVNALISPPGVGKSWMAYAACVEAIRNGRTAIYVDLEDTADTAAARLAGLGITPAQAAQFIYLNHDGEWQPSDTARLVNLTTSTQAAVVIIDGGAEALARAGVDENHNGEVTGWFSTLPRPCAQAGACVIVLEHDPKNAQSKGWGRGAGAKKAALDGASYTLEQVTALTQSQAGKWRLILAKDRPGGTNHSTGDTVATAHVGIDMGTGAVTDIGLGLPDKDKDGRRNPTDVLSSVSRLLEKAQSQRVQGFRNLREALRKESVTFRDEQLRDALDVLERQGCIRVIRQGAGRPTVFEHVELYHPHPTPDPEEI